jgi:hypothetical protein
MEFYLHDNVCVALAGVHVVLVSVAAGADSASCQPGLTLSTVQTPGLASMHG